MPSEKLIQFMMTSSIETPLLSSIWQIMLYYNTANQIRLFIHTPLGYNSKNNGYFNAISQTTAISTQYPPKRQNNGYFNAKSKNNGYFDAKPEKKIHRGSPYIYIWFIRV
jgi:hypothetical protein